VSRQPPHLPEPLGADSLLQGRGLLAAQTRGARLEADRDLYCLIVEPGPVLRIRLLQTEDVLTSVLYILL